MVTEVLSATGGVITEERFKNMTPLQWKLQHSIVRRAENQKMKRDLLINDIMTEAIQTLSYVIDPQLAEAYSETISDHRDQFRKGLFENPESSDKKDKPKNNDISLDNADEIMNTDYKEAPDTIVLPASVTTNNRPILPTFNSDDYKQERRFVGIGSYNENSEEETNGDTGIETLERIEF